VFYCQNGYEILIAPLFFRELGRKNANTKGLVRSTNLS